MCVFRITEVVVVYAGLDIEEGFRSFWSSRLERISRTGRIDGIPLVARIVWGSGSIG
jgi:hypothetical protein